MLSVLGLNETKNVIHNLAILLNVLILKEENNYRTERWVHNEHMSKLCSVYDINFRNIHNIHILKPR